MGLRVICAILLLIAGIAHAQDYELGAPGSVTMRSAFPVDWTAPESENGVLEIRPTIDGRRVGYAYPRQNPQPMEAPEQPGDYVVVMVIGGEVRASAPLAVEMATAALDAPARTDAGAPVPVAWTGPNNRGDRLTFAEPGAAPLRGTSYGYVGNSKDGTVSLRAPQEPGRYDIVYVSGSTVLARSPITVGSISATLSAPATVTAGAELSVTFEGPENSGDLITFATRDGAPIKPASYVYVGNTTGGTATLRAFEKAGPVDVVYLSGGAVIGRSPVEILPASIALNAPATVEANRAFDIGWSGEGNRGDLIHMVAPGEISGRRYRYIDPLEPSVTLTAPETPGAYELVYFTRGGAEMARAPIEVTPAPSLPGRLEVLHRPGAGFGSGDAVQIILDASGSMLQRQDGTRRIEIAKRTLTDLVAGTIPPGTGFALRVFGNREADACRTDLEIPLGPLDPTRATQVIAGITAVNLAKTPIAQSVTLSASDLAAATGQRVLILVTDGEETCEGDPGEAIEALRATGVDVRVNIVGYAIDDDGLARTFESWAAAGGGSFFDAADAQALATALSRATAAPFRVLDETGQLVASGLAGDPALTIPAGRYEVTMGGRSFPATVESERLTSVTPE